MMKICLDTNAYAAMKSGHPRLRELLEKADRLYLPTVALGELHAGFFMRKNAARNVDELRDFLLLPGVELLPVDENVSEQYGWLVKGLREKGTPIPTNDIWIAATAISAGARLVSYDKHFQCISELIVYSP